MKQKLGKTNKPRTPRSAFVQAIAAESFAGVKLEPMTKQREVVAAEMGLKNGFYPMRRQYFLRDTIIILWLSTLKVTSEKGWCVDAAEGDPNGAMQAAMLWADKVGIGIGTVRFQEAFVIYNARMTAIKEARGEPDIPEASQREAPDTGEL